MKPLLSYTKPLTRPQVEKLRGVLADHGFAFGEKEWTLYAASKDKVNVAVYEKGPKVLVQGRGTEDFIRFILEPEVLGVAELGYEEVNEPEQFQPHFGIDESGKGDFFGPLVVAGVYVNRDIAHAFREIGVMDSKRVTTADRIRQLADAIRTVPGGAHYVLCLPPERYNALYPKFKSLNFLLAWAHADVTAVLHRYQPACPRVLSDQFAHASVLARAIARQKLDIQLDQRTKAESDVAVAAASILARERFVGWLDEVSRRLGFTLPKGASAAVKAAAKRLLAERGADALGKVAKLHFKTANEVLGLPLGD